MSRLHDLWRRGRRLARDAATAAELLGEFARHGDETAFAVLVGRLGPLVYGVCRRLLSNPADAEDAFQAAFLVLVRRADALAGRPVGPWLHRVAVLTARRSRRAVRPTLPLPERQTPAATAAVDVRLDLDVALAALPEKYRVPVVLCHLQGLTRRELAAHLGCPESTASSLVGRGLAKLRKRMAGHDTAALAVAGAAVVPPGLIRAAARAAVVFRANSLSAAASPAVADLTEGVLRMFRVKQWAAGLAAAAVMAAGIGFGLAGGGLRPAGRGATGAPAGRPEGPAGEAGEGDRGGERPAPATGGPEGTARPGRAAGAVRHHLRREEGLGRATHRAVGPKPPAGAGQMLGRYLSLGLDASPNAAATYGVPALGEVRGGRSEFTVNEFTSDRPAVEAHFYDLGSLTVDLIHDKPWSVLPPPQNSFSPPPADPASG